MESKLMPYLKEKGFVVSLCINFEQEKSRKFIINKWDDLPEGYVLIIPNTNPKTYEESLKDDAWKTIHQIDNPKFTVEDVTVIRKEGDLILTKGAIEWEGFDTFREVILHLVTWEEAIKIIDAWT